jgi:hypothetical protein
MGNEDTLGKTMLLVIHPDTGLNSRTVFVPATVVDPERPPNHRYLFLIVKLVPSLLKVGRVRLFVQVSVSTL